MQSCQAPVAPVSMSRKVLLVAAIGIFLLIGGSAPAGAACSAAITKDAASTTVSIGKSITAAGTYITNLFIGLNDSLTRLANQMSNGQDKLAKTMTSLTDSRITQSITSSLGPRRAAAAGQFVPSRVVCGLVSQSARIENTRVYYDNTRTALQKANSSYSTNTIGGPTEKGTIQATASAFVDRCQKYANPATMQVPAGLTCNGPADAALRDLDIQPWKAVLDPVMFTTDARVQAAKDAVKMLTEVVTPDPVRGPALLRSEGKTLHVNRMRDVTRMNLARGVLEDMVAMRTADLTDATSRSRLARYIEAVTNRPFDPATQDVNNSVTQMTPEVMAAGEGENAAKQTIAAKLAIQQGLIFELMRLGEQITALEATELAIKVEQTRARTGTVAALPVNN